MAMSNVLLLSQIAGHVVVVFLSLCIVVPMIFHQKDFNGHCLLFSEGDWDENSGLFDVKWASVFYCYFTRITGYVLILVSIFEIYRLSRLALEKQESTFLGLFLDATLSYVSCMMAFGSAIMITLGFIDWCSRITLRFHSCEKSAGVNITEPTQKINTSNFYFQMGIAQFGAWSSFATTVGLTVFAILKLVSDHQMRNMKASMYLERQRLVNDDAFRDAGFSDAPAQHVEEDAYYSQEPHDSRYD